MSNYFYYPPRNSVSGGLFVLKKTERAIFAETETAVLPAAAEIIAGVSYFDAFGRRDLGF